MYIDIIFFHYSFILQKNKYDKDTDQPTALQDSHIIEGTQLNSNDQAMRL